MKCHPQGKLCCAIDGLSYRSLDALFRHLPADDELRKGDSWKRIIGRMAELQRNSSDETQREAEIKYFIKFYRIS
jgi:hypothetical protein